MSLKARYHKWRMTVAKKRMHSQSVPALERVQGRKSFSHHSIRWYQHKDQSYLADAPYGLDITGLDVDPKDYRISTRPGDYETLPDERKKRIDSAIVVGEDKSKKAEFFYHAPRGGQLNSFMAYDGVIRVPDWMEEEDFEDLVEAYKNYKDKN